MALPRIIPVLLLKDKGLVKSIKFKNFKYVGDPINAVKIFNDKEVDELIFLDIDSSKQTKSPNFKYLEEIASECFMPLSYGGGIKNIDQVKNLIQCGIEKVIINTAAIEDRLFIKKASDAFGTSTIITAIDIRKNFWGKIKVYSHATNSLLDLDPVEYAVSLQKEGTGEIFINDVDNDGMMQGYNLDLINKIAQEVDVPVIACGGAKDVKDLSKIINESKVNAAAGSMFVYYGKHKAVLMTYPNQEQIKQIQQNGI